MMPMNLLTVAIIYFACGSPIVMHYVLSSEHGGARLVVSAILRAVSWPVFASYIVFEFLSNRRISASQLRAEAARSVRDEIEVEICTNSSASAVFEFREVFDRYFALNDATFDSVINNGSSEFLAIAGNNNIDIAKACLDRKMRTRILNYAAEARRDMAQLLTSSNASEVAVTKLKELTGDIRLANLVSNGDANVASASSNLSRKAA